MNNFAQALNGDQVRARDMVVNVELHTGETVPMPGNPVKLSAAQPCTFTSPPLLGQHTDEVLRDVVGYDAAHVAALRAAGTVA